MGKKDRAVKRAWDDARAQLQAEIAARLCRSQVLKRQWVPLRDLAPDGFSALQCKSVWNNGRSSLDAGGCLVYPVEGPRDPSPLYPAARAAPKQYTCLQLIDRKRMRWMMAIEHDGRAAGGDAKLCRDAMNIPCAAPTAPRKHALTTLRTSVATSCETVLDSVLVARDGGAVGGAQAAAGGAGGVDGAARSPGVGAGGAAVPQTPKVGDGPAAGGGTATRTRLYPAAPPGSATETGTPRQLEGAAALREAAACSTPAMSAARASAIVRSPQPRICNTLDS